jgi:hypothetical protein
MGFSRTDSGPGSLVEGEEEREVTILSSPTRRIAMKTLSPVIESLH